MLSRSTPLQSGIQSTRNIDWNGHIPIKTWEQFSKEIRSQGCRLLDKLDDYPNSILVTGCQRSGTTMLANILLQSEGIVDFVFGQDNELDSALVLSGYVMEEPKGRYCFQTTYVNECYHEYFQHTNGHKIVWVLRNPISVVYSMLHNWGGHTPNRLFESCGVPFLKGTDKWKYRVFGRSGLSLLRRACWGYIGKTNQLFSLVDHLGADVVMIVDYDDLVSQKDLWLKAIYQFVDLEYREGYSNAIQTSSLNKREQFSTGDSSEIIRLCEPIYHKARTLIKAP